MLFRTRQGCHHGTCKSFVTDCCRLQLSTVFDVIVLCIYAVHEVAPCFYARLVRLANTCTAGTARAETLPMKVLNFSSTLSPSSLIVDVIRGNTCCMSYASVGLRRVCSKPSENISHQQQLNKGGATTLHSRIMSAVRTTKVKDPRLHAVQHSMFSVFPLTA